MIVMLTIVIIILLVCFEEISELNDKVEDISCELSYLKTEISDLVELENIEVIDGEIIDFKAGTLKAPIIRNGEIIDER